MYIDTIMRFGTRGVKVQYEAASCNVVPHIAKRCFRGISQGNKKMQCSNPNLAQCSDNAIYKTHQRKKQVASATAAAFERNLQCALHCVFQAMQNSEISSHPFWNRQRKS
jgi:hypothetical protein